MTTTAIKDILYALDRLQESDQVGHEVKDHFKYLMARYKKEEAANKTEDTIRIEVTFPVPVYIAEQSFRRLVDLVSEITKDYEKMHPGRVMWPAGMGSKITYMPMTRAEEEAGKTIQFAKDILHIEVCEREDYDWPCAKCGKAQDDHKHLMVNPVAGECEFEPTPTKPKKGRTTNED